MEDRIIIVKRITLMEETFQVCADTLEEAINIIKNDDETGDSYLIAQNILTTNDYRAEDITNKTLSISDITGIYPRGVDENDK